MALAQFDPCCFLVAEMARSAASRRCGSSLGHGLDDLDSPRSKATSDGDRKVSKGHAIDSKDLQCRSRWRVIPVVIRFVWCMAVGPNGAQDGESARKTQRFMIYIGHIGAYRC